MGNNRREFYIRFKQRKIVFIAGQSLEYFGRIDKVSGGIL